MRIRAGTLVVSLFWVAGWAIGNGQTIPQAVKAQHAKQYSEYHAGVNILGETQAGKDVDRNIEILSPLYAFDPAENVADYPDHELRSIACDADAIVVGSPKSAETDLTESGDFLFTDYTFNVASVLKSNDSNPAAYRNAPGGYSDNQWSRRKDECWQLPAV